MVSTRIYFLGCPFMEHHVDFSRKTRACNKYIAVRVLGGIPSIPPSPLGSFLKTSIHSPKLRLRVASIIQVDIQTKVRKIQEFAKIPGREKTGWGIETGS